MGQQASQPEATLDALPTQWLFYLDPSSLLCIQRAGYRIEEALEESIWKELCAQELEIPSEQLQLGGASWRRLYVDLDPSTRQNELRSKDEDYAFLPSVYGEEPRVPEGISFEGLSCQLCASHLGRDRCILARWPLAAPHCATAYLQRVAYRRTAYYEVTIGHASEPQGMPCISIGLCSPRFPRHAVCRQQAGWDAESWAMHSDDGLLFHSSNRGVEASGATFGPGDVVGCGLQHCLSEPEEIRKIFYTLNGRFLGYAFEVDVPLEVPLWPCVGLDTKQWLTFNFGREPFLFDFEKMDGLEVAPEPTVERGEQAPMWPRQPRLFPRPFVAAREEAEDMVLSYQNQQPRWLDAVDRLVNATLLAAADDAHLGTALR